MYIQRLTSMIKKTYVVLIILILTTLMIPGNVYAQEPDTTQDVLVPVTLDGVLYQPAEFNAIHQKLHSNGQYIFFIVKKGNVEAFSNLDDLCKKYSLKFDLTEINEQQDDTVTIRSIDPGYAYNWVDINRGGNCSVIQEGWQGNLSSQWRNEISSVWYEADTSSAYCVYFLCEDLDYGGDWCGFMEDYGSDDLGDQGFNDTAESVLFAYQ